MSDPSDGLPYNVDLTLAVIDGRYECTELMVWRRKGGEPITTRGIGTLPIGRLITDLVGSEAPEPLGGWRDIPTHVAAIYRHAYRCNLPPTKEVARILGLSQDVASQRVLKARRAGLLDPTTTGKAAV